MFHESVFVFYCCITASFVEMKNNLLEYVDVYAGHIQKKHFSSEHMNYLAQFSAPSPKNKNKLP